MKRKFTVIKTIIILLMALYVVLSCFEFDEIISNEVNNLMSFQFDFSNLSLGILIPAAIYGVLLFTNHSALQIISGMIALFPGMCLPLTVHVKNLFEEVTAHTGERYTQWRLTPIGIVQTVLSWSLLLLIISYVVMHKNAKKKKTAKAAFERDEVIK